MNTATRVQILREIIGTSHSANTPRKVIHSPILLPGMGKSKAVVSLEWQPL